MRYLLLYFAIKYKGSWEKIYKAVCDKEIAEIDELKLVKNKNGNNWITLIDKDYPRVFKCSSKPPFVIFLEGNKNLLKDYDDKFIAIESSYNDFNLEPINRDCSDEEWQQRMLNSVFFIEYKEKYIIKALMKLKAKIVAINEKCYEDIKQDKLCKSLLDNNNLIISYSLDTWKLMLS